jgi:hypothetical protein
MLVVLMLKVLQYTDELKGTHPLRISVLNPVVTEPIQSSIAVKYLRSLLNRIPTSFYGIPQENIRRG